jgi:hypothetical protein
MFPKPSNSITSADYNQRFEAKFRRLQFENRLHLNCLLLLSRYSSGESCHGIWLSLGRRDFKALIEQRELLLAIVIPSPWLSSTFMEIHCHQWLRPGFS